MADTKTFSFIFVFNLKTVMLLAAAVLAATAVANTGRPVWTVVPKTDCGGWDVKTHLACAAHPPHASPSVLTLKACCLSLPQGECGGFNTHGVMKKPGCQHKEGAEPTVDLYLLNGGAAPPAPPAPPPAPQCAALPAGRLPPADTLPVFHVLAGAEPRGKTLCESNSSNAVVLRALCAATRGCAAFTVGSGGGEPVSPHANNQPPHSPPLTHPTPEVQAGANPTAAAESTGAFRNFLSGCLRLKTLGGPRAA